jgi:hypothetical protein
LCWVSTDPKFADAEVFEMANHSQGASHAPQGGAAAGTTVTRPQTIDELIAIVHREFPYAAIRITGRARTVRRQAELMAQRRRANRRQFLRTYRHGRHITEMDLWVARHLQASEQETVDEFVRIINRARSRGARVSNHLSDQARDIGIPVGGHAVETRVRARLQELGGHVIDEHDAVGGAHWHVDF